MSMSEIRKAYGVPAKRGMPVRIKAGRWAGRSGFIRGSNLSQRLYVVDVEKGRYGWWGQYHPKDLEYLPMQPNTSYPER